MAMYQAMIHEDALLLREATGTSDVIETACAAAASLARYEIAHLLIWNGLQAEK
jgi:hypothetical protein